MLQAGPTSTSTFARGSRWNSSSGRTKSGCAALNGAVYRSRLSDRLLKRCLRSSIARPENDARGAEAAASDSRSEIGGRRRLNILFPGRECSPGRRLRPRSASVPALGAQGPRRREKSKFLFPEGSGAGISTPSASADPLLAGAGTAASAVVGCSRERARAASSALADIVAGSLCYPRDVFAAARPLLLARKEERCVGARSRSTSVHSNNSLCSGFGRLGNPPS